MARIARRLWANPDTGLLATDRSRTNCHLYERVWLIVRLNRGYSRCSGVAFGGYTGLGLSLKFDSIFRQWPGSLSLLGPRQMRKIGASLWVQAAKKVFGKLLELLLLNYRNFFGYLSNGVPAYASCLLDEICLDLRFR